MLQIGEKKLLQELGKDNLTLSLTKSASIGYFPAFFVFISRYGMHVDVVNLFSSKIRSRLSYTQYENHTLFAFFMWLLVVSRSSDYWLGLSAQ